MWADDPSRDEIRRRSAEVFERAEFRRPVTFLHRIGRWISDFFEWLLGGRQAGPTSSPSSLIGHIVVWLILVLIAGLVVWLAIIAVRSVRVRRSRRSRAGTTGDDVMVVAHRSAEEWQSEAEQAEAAGDWKLAIQARYRLLVRELVDRKVVSDLVGCTTGELRLDVAKANIGIEDLFDQATLLFELPWYSDAPTGPAENAQIRDLSAQIHQRIPAGRGRDRHEVMA